jgi:23S rRNA (adenine2503-C2)-methyltransferase
MNADQATLYDLSREELADELSGQPRYRIDQIWEGLYSAGSGLDDLTSVPAKLRTRLAEKYPLALQETLRSEADDGETVKWLFGLRDGGAIETVLMHYDKRSTVCVSTQAGCAMACGFCATGQAGFDRNLSAGEIVEQVLRARRAAGERRISNIVFMGMGEPLANYDSTWTAVHRIRDDIGISARRLTLSTVGLVPGIKRLAADDLPVNLAVSLHAANDELRDELVPINRRYPLTELMAACTGYVEATRRRLSFEWALIDGINDRESDATELSRLARPLGAHVNLIPLNPTPGYPTVGTPARRVARFRTNLESLGVNVTVRRTRGTEIDAACGQLRAANPLAVRAEPASDE